jgi:hypothetical protein
MTTPLDYQRSPALTPAQKRAATHLLAWTIAMWVLATGAVLVIAGEIVNTIMTVVRGRFDSSRLLDIFLALTITSLLGVTFWRSGRRLMLARKGILFRSRPEFAAGAGTIDTLLLITVFTLVIWGILAATGGPDLAVGIPVAAMLVTPLALAFWSRRQLPHAERELWTAAPSRPRSPT